MHGMRLPLAVALASAMACAGGADGPSSSSAFDPTRGADGTGPATAGSTDDAATTMPPGDAPGDPPSGGSCCAVAATPGCSDPEIETCVCTIEPACCQDAWSPACVALATDPCGDPACMAPGSTGEPGDGSSGGGPPTLSCDALAMQEGWTYWRCQDGDSQCSDVGTPTTDCDFCCGYCNAPGDVSCGDLATMNGWAPGTAQCEWNGNGACGGQGTPTCDCSVCCQAG